MTELPPGSQIIALPQALEIRLKGNKLRRVIAMAYDGTELLYLGAPFASGTKAPPSDVPTWFRQSEIVTSWAPEPLSPAGSTAQVRGPGR